MSILGPHPVTKRSRGIERHPRDSSPCFQHTELLVLAFRARSLLPSPRGRPRVAARQTALTPLAAFSNKVAQICHGTKTGTFRLRDQGRVAKGRRNGGGFLDFFLRFPRRLKSGFLRAPYVFLPRAFRQLPAAASAFSYTRCPRKPT